MEGHPRLFDERLLPSLAVGLQVDHGFYTKLRELSILVTVRLRAAIVEVFDLAEVVDGDRRQRRPGSRGGRSGHGGSGKREHNGDGRDKTTDELAIHSVAPF